MKAITTKVLASTSTKPTRIVASDMDGNRIILPWSYSWSNEDEHRRAAYALRDQMGWTGRLVGGGIKGGMVWVFV